VAVIIQYLYIKEKPSRFKDVNISDGITPLNITLPLDNVVTSHITINIKLLPIRNISHLPNLVASSIP
jgi:hypothetical protein